MEKRFNPRIFLVLAIGNYALAGISLVGCIVLLAMGSANSSFGPLLASIIFSQIGSLAGWQYRAMRANDDKLKKLQEGLEQGEELTAR
jgi:hypothetical protein